MAQRHATHTAALTLLIISTIGLLLWYWQSTRTLESLHAGVSNMTAQQPMSVDSISRGTSTIRIPDWSWFSEGNLWNLVSKQRTLSDSYTPNLVSAPVEHTNETMQVASAITSPLRSLFAAAKADGSPLMLSSAYRSAQDQQDIYASYLRTYGASYVASYVATPGTSEHQTGLAVDIASADTNCKRSANNCSLDYEAIQWLSNNAARYGFIQRYPAGKQSITGIAGEAWHYRYVGVVLAKFLDMSDLTFDEFVQQAAPGYAR